MAKEERKVKKERNVYFGMALLICFLVHALTAKQFINWYCTDVEGYLGHAATFLGKDWSGVLKNADSFYSWGYSLLLMIPMALTNNITLINYIVVFLHSFLCCGILLISYFIAKNIFLNINKFFLLLCSMAVSLYSGYIFYATVMLSEILLVFCVFLCTFCLLRYIKDEKNIWGGVSGFLIGFVYIIHNRTIAIVIAYIIISVLLSIKTKNCRHLFIMLIPLACMLLINQEVVQYLKLHEMQGNSYSRNTYESYANKLNKGIHFFTIISLMECVLGECWYALIGSFGMVGLGVYSLGKQLYLAWINKKREIYWYMFLLLSLIGTLGVSVLAIMTVEPLEPKGRYDLYIYGRYWECILGIFVFFGLIACYDKLKSEILIGIVLLELNLSVVVEYITKAYQNNGYNYWGIPAVLTTFFYPERKFTVYSSSIVGITFCVLFFFLIYLNKKSYLIVAIGFWSFFNVFFAYNLIYNVADIQRGQVRNMPLCNTDFVAVCHYLQDNMVDEFAVCIDDGYRRVISFQLMFMDGKIIGIASDEEKIDAEIYVVDSGGTGEKRGKVLYENNSYCIIENSESKNR